MFPLSEIQRARCSKCQTVMMLARISPAGEGREEGLFERPKCDHVDNDSGGPQKSAAGWLDSELKAADLSSRFIHSTTVAIGRPQCRRKSPNVW